MIARNPTSILRPAEWVFPGHPDKLADAIADSLVQAAMEREAKALCAIEVAVHRDCVYLTGRLACKGSTEMDLTALVQDVYRTAGYGGRWRPAPEDIKVQGNLCLDTLMPEEAKYRHISDDQSIVTGYAINLPQIGYIPPEQWIARELARELYKHVGSSMDLCPDGKVLIILDENPCKSNTRNDALTTYKLHSVSASLLAPGHVGGIALNRAVVVAVQNVLSVACRKIPGMCDELPETIVVNGSGNFHTGGPEGDNGLSGKKLLMDYYGPRVPIGGSALCGKDFYKVDRVGAITAREMARALVQTEGLRDVTVLLTSFPGEIQPKILGVITTTGAENRIRYLRNSMIRKSNEMTTFLPGIDLVQSSRWGQWT